MVVDALIGTHEAGADGGYTIRLRRRLRADTDDVWSALTTPARLERWLAPVTGEVRLGGRFRLAFREGGSAQGVVDVCEPPSRLGLTWRMPGDPEGRVEVTVTADPAAASVLRIEHAGVGERNLVGYLAGWQTYLEQIDLLLGGHDFPDWWDRYRHLRRR